MDAPTAPFAPTDEHRRLHRLAGAWSGTARTWFGPGSPAMEAPWAGEITPLLGGRFVRFTYRSSLEGKPLAGELTVGFHVGEGEWTAAWLDSFHTGTDLMRSVGPKREAGPIGFAGTYFAAPGHPRWGWRTELDDGAEGALRLRMYNVTPDGQEALGVEVELTRG